MITDKDVEVAAREICLADGVDPEALGYGLGRQFPEGVRYPLWQARRAQARAALVSFVKGKE